MSNPQSTINVCRNVRLTPSYTHTIYFDTPSEQLEYFAGKVNKTFSAYSFLRKNWDIRVDATYNQAREWTYLYLNNGVGSKTYFYFITDIEYIAESTVQLKLELDVMQTYMFDYEMLDCFVEREHVADDTIGSNLLDEGLDLGDYGSMAEFNIDLTELCILVLSSINPETTTAETTVKLLSAVYDGVYSALGVYAVDLKDYNKLGEKLLALDEMGKSDSIVSMWMYPKNLVTLDSDESWSSTKTFKIVKSSAHRIEKFSGFDGNLPNVKNNKLLCYPYRMLYATNNCGESAIYKYEHFGYFADSDFEFRVDGAISPDGSVKLTPRNYKGHTNFDEGLTLSGFPTCAWNQDIYKLWLAQNQNQQRKNNIQSMVTAGTGLVTTIASAFTGSLPTAGAGLGMVGTGLSQITSQMAQKKDAEIQPPQAKGSFSSNVNIGIGCHTFTLKDMRIDLYHQKMIDDYFSLYGYKCQQVKIPNRNVRTNWTYTKTVDCCIAGNISTADRVKIESIYNNGITFWVDGDSIGNYYLDNSCKGV